MSIKYCLYDSFPRIKYIDTRGFDICKCSMACGLIINTRKSNACRDNAPESVGAKSILRLFWTVNSGPEKSRRAEIWGRSW